MSSERLLIHIKLMSHVFQCSCHSCGSRNPVSLVFSGFRIKSGMTKCVKLFLRQYTKDLTDAHL